MFTWTFAKRLFDGFTIMRWTDFIRPCEFVQIEKSASQAALAYIIGKEYEERTGKKLDWEFIVGSNIYGLLFKIATSDIKSTVSNKIKKDKDYLPQLKTYVLGVYFKDGKCKYKPECLISSNEFARYIEQANFKDKIDEEHKTEYEVCYLAHKFATYREFCYIKGLNSILPDTKRVESELQTANIKANIENKTLKEIFHELEYDSDLLKFYSYFEKLRPQIRWSQTCRIPQTTVLGHSMYVAMLTYFAIKELEIDKAKERILVDSFFAALFHDLPESLTRDIISPVKRNVGGLEDKLSAYEYEVIQKNMISNIKNKEWHNDFLKLLGADKNRFDPFKNNEFILGELVKKMDYIAAFMEAKMSIEMGISSEELQKGINSTIKSLQNSIFSYSSTDFTIKNKLYFNDFLASIPQYKEGILNNDNK